MADEEEEKDEKKQGASADLTGVVAGAVGLATEMAAKTISKIMDMIMKLIMAILKLLFGGGDNDPENDKKMKGIAGIAEQMIQKQMDDDPGLFTAKNLKDKNPETMQALADTITAATAAHGLLSGSKNKVGDLMDQREDQKNALNKVEPGTPAHDQLKKDIKETENAIKTELKDLNKQDTNEQRKDAFDKNIDKEDFFEKYDKSAADMKDVSSTMQDGKPLSDAQDKTLTASLENLHGMDPRIEGAGVAPVTQVMGNQMGVPDNNPAFTAFEPLHAMSGAKDNPSHEANKQGKDLDSDKVKEAANTVLDSDAGQEMTHQAPEPPSPSPK
jgi:hypothetical protein